MAGRPQSLKASGHAPLNVEQAQESRPHAYAYKEFSTLAIFASRDSVCMAFEKLASRESNSFYSKPA
jgi:hypothetical protein